MVRSITPEPTAVFLSVDWYRFVRSMETRESTEELVWGLWEISISL